MVCSTATPPSVFFALAWLAPLATCRSLQWALLGFTCIPACWEMVACGDVWDVCIVRPMTVVGYNTTRDVALLRCSHSYYNNG